MLLTYIISSYQNAVPVGKAELANICVLATTFERKKKETFVLLHINLKHIRQHLKIY